MKRHRLLARRYWFDGVIVVGLGLSVAIAVIGQSHEHGPEGPLGRGLGYRPTYEPAVDAPAIPAV